MKKVGKYLVITILMLLGLFCVGILYLFFIPNSSLFNITYINHHKKIESEKYAVDNIDELKINSRSYDVNIKPSNSEKVSVEVESYSFGFVHTKNADIKLSSSTRDNVLTINISEPYGLSTNNSSLITVYMPKTKILNLNLSNKYADTFINSKDLTINNLTYSTQEGNLELENLTINGKLNLNLNRSICTINSSVKTNLNDVDLKLTTGRFLAEKSKLDDITILKNSRGNIIVKECDILSENIKSAGGQIKIKKLSHINVKASDTIINIDEVLDGAIIDLVGGGKINITKLSGNSALSTNSGSININNCLSSATLHSDEGNITVKNAMKTISTKTNYGDINISFSKDADHYSAADEDKSRTLHATIHHGKLIATGVEHIGSSEIDNNQGIVVTGNGRVYLNMTDVCGENLVTGKNGNVKIIVNHSSVYKLTTNPENKTKGNVRVNLMQIAEYNGYKTKSKKETFVNCTESTFNNNTLTVSTTTGDLVILDTKLS